MLPATVRNLFGRFGQQPSGKTVAALLHARAEPEAAETKVESQPRTVWHPARLAMAHLLLAQIHRRQNNSAAVVDDLDAYLRLEPDGPRSHALRTTRDAAQQSLNMDPTSKPDDAVTVDR